MRGARRTRLGNGFQGAVGKLVRLQNGVVDGIVLDLTARLAVEDDLAEFALLLTVLKKGLEVEVDGAEIRVGTMLVPVHDGHREVVVEVVEKNVLGLVPVRRRAGVVFQGVRTAAVLREQRNRPPTYVLVLMAVLAISALPAIAKLM